MKLYTEEQVIEFTMNMISQYEFGNKVIWNRELLKELFQYVEPIELPSDEDLDKWIVNRNYEFSKVDIQTTKWVIEQIKKQDNA
jgi:hypothetical protein